MKNVSKGKKIGIGILALVLLVFFMGLSGAVPPSPEFMAFFNLIMAAVIIGLATWLDKVKTT